MKLRLAWTSYLLQTVLLHNLNSPGSIFLRRPNWVINRRKSLLALRLLFLRNTYIACWLSTNRRATTEFGLSSWTITSAGPDGCAISHSAAIWASVFVFADEFGARLTTADNRQPPRTSLVIASPPRRVSAECNDRVLPICTLDVNSLVHRLRMAAGRKPAVSGAETGSQRAEKVRLSSGDLLLLPASSHPMV